MTSTVILTQQTIPALGIFRSKRLPCDTLASITVSASCNNECSFLLMVFQSIDGVNYDHVSSIATAIEGSSSVATLSLSAIGKWFYVQIEDVPNNNMTRLSCVAKLSVDSVAGAAAALGDLDMQGYDIVDANVIQCQTLEYTTLDPPIVSQWVGDATSNLVMTNYDITGVNRLEVDGTIALFGLGEASLPIITNVTTINGNPVQFLTASDGIDITDGDISTVGNPGIQLTYRSFYCNDGGGKDISTAFAEAAGLQVCQFYLSGGSFGGSALTISGQTNWGIIGPLNQGSLVELGSTGSPRSLTINNSTRICMSCVGLKGDLVISGTGTAHKFFKCAFSENVTISGLTGGFLTFENCSFASGKTLTFAAGFAGACYLINCDMAGVTFVCDQPLATQVIINNCSGLTSFTSPAKRTLVGLSTLVAGTANINTNNLNTTTINGAAYPPTGSTFDPTNQAPVKYGSTGVGTGAGVRSVSIGDGTGANPTFPNGSDSVSIGTQANARAAGTIAIGQFALAAASYGTAIGQDAYSGGNSVSVGYSAGSGCTTATSTLVGNEVGTGASADLTNSTLIGWHAGYNAQALYNSVVVGESSAVSTNTLDLVCIGRNSCNTSTGTRVLTVGSGSGAGVDSKNIIIGSGSMNGAGSNKGCVIVGHDVSNFATVADNTLIINNSQSFFDPGANTGSVFIANVRTTGIDVGSYPNEYNAISYRSDEKELSKQRVYIGQGVMDGSNPATLTLSSTMFDSIANNVVMFNKMTFGHPNSKISFTMAGGQLVFTGDNGDNDTLAVYVYRTAG